MRLIKNIDKIIRELVGEDERKKMENEFFDFLKKGEVGKVNTNKKEKGELKIQEENKKKYKKYDGTSKKFLKLKKDFFKKLYDDGNCFCCYCGKDRITHFEGIDGKFKRLYDIEHFLPRSKFPDLSVNLYNWLPVCMSCNQRLKKASNPLDNGEVFHPYFGFINSAVQQRASALGNSLDKKFSFSQNDKKKKLIFNSNHSKFFKLSEIYLNSQDTFNIFKFIQDKRTKIKAEKKNYIKKSSKTYEQLKNYFFKNYAPETEEEILKFSNGKLKKDLIENLKI